MTRAALIALSVLGVSACTGPVSAPRGGEQVAPEKKDGTGVRVSGYATFGYVKGR
ncbi:hypothetical protein [Roseobacter sp. A03A-229]